MGAFEIGVVLPIMQFGPERTTPRWSDLRRMARAAEEIGFDTLWIADELLWRSEDGPHQGAWDGVSMAGAAAATTSRIKRPRRRAGAAARDARRDLRRGRTRPGDDRPRRRAVGQSVAAVGLAPVGHLRPGRGDR